jgi:hypothetical protein
MPRSGQRHFEQGYDLIKNASELPRYLWQAWLNSGFSLGVGAAPSANEGGATSGAALEEDR